MHYFTTKTETEALAGISLSIRAGAFVSIIGQNSSGKSTLLSLIAGLMQPTSGSVLVDGQRVD